MKRTTVEGMAIGRVVFEGRIDIHRLKDIQREIHIITQKIATKMTEMSDTIEGMKIDQKIDTNIETMDLITEIDREDMDPEVKVEVEVETDIHILRAQDVTTKAVPKEKQKSISKKWLQMNRNPKKEFNTKIV